MFVRCPSLKKFNPERPVIFLDIDGVLNSEEDRQHSYISDLFNMLETTRFSMGDWITNSKLERLHEFLSVIDAQVIMVSSWFCGNPTTFEQKQKNAAICDFLGLTNRTLAISRYTGGGLHRGSEVLKIVESLGLVDWVVIDDAGSNMYEFDTHQIDGRVGLTDTDILILIERLRNGQH